MQIPKFLLRKLYVKGSLENTDDGFVFKIKNSLSAGTAIGMTPIKVDGTEYPLETIHVKSGDAEVMASEISESNAFPIKVGVEIAIHIHAEQLEEGEHKIDISIKTKEAGNLAFDVKDSI
ncbi:MAG: hydroxymethylglutaryl-CoA reductase [Candidatus Lokiarchaeota archaeon]|nr:hydroxymethylglutaryl-CoA reductase [Candidatus Lokiarchaeota archaeon]